MCADGSGTTCCRSAAVLARIKRLAKLLPEQKIDFYSSAFAVLIRKLPISQSRIPIPVQYCTTVVGM